MGVYVSITGLKLRGIWHFPRFARHASAAMAQAKRAEGCLQADATTIGGIHHTRTVWVNKEAMRAYLTSGAHLRAMHIFDRIATGKTYGADMDTVPDWTQARALWDAHAVTYSGPPRSPTPTHPPRP